MRSDQRDYGTWIHKQVSDNITSGVNGTLAERGSRYGDFTDNANISQTLKDTMWATDGWVRLNAVQREGLEMIVQKVARILNGDPNYADNWHDIQGYARLVEERLPEDKE